ncbi:MAG TPA: abortive infection protein [Prolixibacteraceae bacterium]|jgi:hypothetical protein|nr:abortive infection protein [Prolixibacteraceae bacterium]
MIYKGITYDVGTEYKANILTRDQPSEALIKTDMEAIKNKLNCNSVRIYGKDPKTLLAAAGIALEYGLNVWLSPRLINGNREDTLSYLKSIAIEFERLKVTYPSRELVFMIGGELTIDMKGFIEGETIHARIVHLFKPLFFLKNMLGFQPKYQRAFNQFLKDAAAEVKKEFSGKVTYASGVWEKVDWSDFDFISVNYYKASFNKKFYTQKLKKLVSQGKPVAITEFGCCSFDGADDKGPMGYTVLDLSKRPPVFKEKCIRNEKVQADYLVDLLQTYDREKIAGAFIFDFYSQKHTHSIDPEKDYDMASFSITKSLGNNHWEPKESFYSIADYYKEN